MLFKRLCLENFGAFRGRHIFDLAPALEGNDPKPIILFGGLNGSGKTTLFESIKLCLYGRLYSKNMPSKFDYENYVRSKILPKNGDKIKVNHGAIELDFSYSSFGEVHNYSVRRFWQVKQDKTDENLRILRDDKILGSVEKENSQAFLMNLIPRGLTDLFFFDGEKIQTLANDDDSYQFKESFDSMLGLDAILKLQNDLRIYQTRLSQKDESTSVKETLNRLKIEKIECGKQYEGLLQQRAKNESDKDYIHQRIEVKEIELANLGGGYASQRETTKQQISEVEEETSVLRSEISNICAALFPFALVPELCTKLRNKLFQEQVRKTQDSAKTLLQGNISNFLEATKQQILPQYHLPEQEEEKFIAQIAKLLKEVLLETKEEPVHLIHDFSETELSNIISWIDQSLTLVPSEMARKSGKLESVINKRRNLEELLQKVPAEQSLGPIVEEINGLNQNYGAINLELKKIDEKVASLRYRLTEIEREIDRTHQKLDEIESSSRRLDLLRKTNQILIDFADIMRKKKIEALSRNFTFWMNRLMYKENFLSEVLVSSDNYSIRLKQPNGNFVAKSELSDGEKQIYAITMLMALARTSEHSLPFIIDTPLARLDSSHRKSIVSEFLPYASHQVIMFSTDTEVDENYFRNLSPYISRAYHLDYKPETISTIVEEGYFWRKEEVISD